MEALEAIIPAGDSAVGVASCRKTRMVYDYYPRFQSRSCYLIYAGINVVGKYPWP